MNVLHHIADDLYKTLDKKFYYWSPRTLYYFSEPNGTVIINIDNMDDALRIIDQINWAEGLDIIV